MLPPTQRAEEVLRLGILHRPPFIFQNLSAGKVMRAAWYERQGPARDVLTVGEMADPQPGAGEVRIRIAASGVNPGDVKKREDAFGLGMSYPCVILHSDGAGVIDSVGGGVPDPPRWDLRTQKA